MWITAFFTNEGSPVTGLTPSINVWNAVTDDRVVDEEIMSEIGGGWYKYDLTPYDETTNYVISCDGGTSLSPAERYTYAGNENYVVDINQFLSSKHGDGPWSTSDSTTPVFANIVEVQGEHVNSVDDFKADISPLVEISTRILGLVQENFYIDDTIYNDANQMTSSRIRIYSDSTSVGTNHNVIGTYLVQADYDSNGNLETYKMEKI